MKTRDLEFWIELVFRRRLILWQVAAAVFGMVLVGSILWPPLYESASKVLVQIDRAQLLVSPGMNASEVSQSTVMANPVNEQDLNSEVELLSSPYLIEQALEGLPPPNDSSIAAAPRRLLGAVLGLPTLAYNELHNAPGMTSGQQLEFELARRLSVSVIRRSNIIEVSFRSHDSIWCRKFLSRLLDQYLVLHARISHDPQAEQFFRQQAALLQDKLRRSEERLRALQLQTGISSLAEQKQALINELYSFDTDYHKTSAQLAATKRQVVALKAQMARAPKYQLKESRVVQNLALQQMKPQLLAMEAERAELLSRYQPTSERVREMDAKLDAAKKVLSKENQTEVQESTNDLNSTWSELDSQLAQAKATAASLEASRQTLAKQLSESAERLRGLTTDGLAIERSQREVDTDKEAFLSYVRKGEEARAARALNQSKILNVSIVQPPTEPLQPIFPKLSTNLACGIFLALALGLAAAYWEEANDPKLYSIRAVEKASGLRALAVLPDEL